MTVSRRAVLGTGAAAAVGLAAPATIARADETLTIAAYGGEFQDIFTRTVVQPFEKKFSCKVIYDASGTQITNYAKIRATRGAPGFDVAAELTAGQNILGGREKLLELLTEKEVPNLAKQWPMSLKIVPQNGIVSYYQYIGLVWNPKKIKKPESWLDYWEPQRAYGDMIKGHVLAHGISNFELAGYALLMAAKSKGGDERHMGEAWTLLKAQKPYLGPVTDTSAAAAPYLENEQVWIGPYWSGRAIYYKKRGYSMDLTTPKEGTVALAPTSSVPIGAKNKRLAFEFLNFRLEPEIQHDFCSEYNVSPARPDLTGWSPEFVAEQVTTAEQMNRLVFPDLDYLGTQVRPWTESWQDIMAT